MSRLLSLSNEEYLKTREDSRLSIAEEDIPGLVELAKFKGYQDSDVVTLYVVAVEGIPEETHSGEYAIYEEFDLKQLAKDVERMLYDESKKRLVGFIPPIPHLGTN